MESVMGESKVDTNLYGNFEAPILVVNKNPRYLKVWVGLVIQ